MDGGRETSAKLTRKNTLLDTFEQISISDKCSSSMYGSKSLTFMESKPVPKCMSTISICGMRHNLHDNNLHVSNDINFFCVCVFDKRHRINYLLHVVYQFVYLLSISTFVNNNNNLVGRRGAMACVRNELARADDTDKI